MATTTLTDPVSPELRTILRALKLGKLLDTLPERITLAKQQHLPHADFLELVLADEVTRRDTTSAALRARTAGLDPHMRLDTGDPTATVRYDQQLWTELTTLRFSTAPTGLCCWARSGSAKPTSRPRSGTSPYADDTACTWPAPTNSSNASKPPG
jgi:IstB-like ATP binding protein